MGPGGETGRRKGLKILFPQGSVGSIPTPGTSIFIDFKRLASLKSSRVRGVSKICAVDTPKKLPSRMCCKQRDDETIP